MAGTKKPRKSLSGPYVNAAVFCENPLEDTKGMISVIRIFDRTEGELPAEFGEGDSVAINTWFFVAVKSGDARGKHRLQLFLVAPTGKKELVSEGEIVLLGDENGSNLRANLSLTIQSEGLYWMNVVIDGRTVTRTPLRVVLRKASEPASGPTIPPTKTRAAR
jgi:hypothetical protein